MNIKKQLIVAGAALAAALMASPASATIYTYNLSGSSDNPFSETGSGAVSIDTSTQQGRIVYKSDRSDLNFVFNSSTFANFEPTSFQNFLSLVTSASGKYIVDGNQINISNYDFNAIKTEANFYQKNGGFRFNYNIPGNIFYEFILDPVAIDVPEPAMLGLFGAGAVMVMMGRRRRPLAKNSAGKAQGNARLAMA